MKKNLYTMSNPTIQPRWYDRIWWVGPVYFALGFFNILFAWLGLIFFCLPLIMALAGGEKFYCNRCCDRGQLLTLLGGRLGLSRNKTVPRWMRSKAFRYGFLIFFFAMFFQMLAATVLVFQGARELGSVVTLFWTFKVPWAWAAPSWAAPGLVQFAYGFYSLMLTSTLIGLIVMVLFKPRAWCVFCPMGTMTQLICRAKAHGKED